MTEFLSVILPTYNPHASRLLQTISGLKVQTLPFASWELIIVDNNSAPAVNIDLSWHPNHKIVKEAKPGLTHARLKGFEQASGAIIVMVDDDNVLDKDYLKNTLSLFGKSSTLGAIGGKSMPLFESPPPLWLNEFYGSLALRDLGDEPIISTWKNEYPNSAPIGAGMGIRITALGAYIDKIKASGSIISDRTGNELTSGGDNDMVIEILRSGWQVGYFPSLQLHHIIPEQRMQVNYLARLLNNTNRSWIQVLEKHHINPWKKVNGFTVPFRKTKAWFTYRAWQSAANYIKWQGACGLFDGLATIKTNAKT
ncbi:glycosyltransferase [Mucilaginibacter sp.]|uniref:glycosyltransferase n=1 Tax=Mucilaginibacter sp. TaxID=1882438 RepID=UPI0025F30F8E|nr:glycosyltransferase [Mucilaginibacter sp.]